ncbi:MAG: glycoside hydrolase/phage tail family protein [Pseudomonadota bacterium]
MATLILSAVGAAAGSAIGGSALGLSAAVIGRAVGATVGQFIDQRLFGQKVLGTGAELVEQGRVDRFRVSGASEGAGIEEVHGRTRVAGQVIWASEFLETATDEVIENGGGGGGKGRGGRSGSSSTTVRSYSYSVSLAIALCEGEISHVGRIWADGSEVSQASLNFRVYPGSNNQTPDPKIEATEGAGVVPAFRGTAYVVIEDLQLEAYGNRVPQFNFEIIRPEQVPSNPETDLPRQVRAVALVPGTGEYALATQPVYLASGPGQSRAANINSPSGLTDFRSSLDTMRAELPAQKATSLIVSWFGTDLRCGNCQIAPRVEQKQADGKGMPWRASGVTRWTAGQVPYVDGRPLYGGTPADASVMQALAALREGGRKAMFYPFVLMEQLAGNGLPDPWSSAGNQPALPWRGRITLSEAPGRPASPDGTAAAEAEVQAFFGTAAPSNFVPVAGTILYLGPAEFSYRRFILHYAWLCKEAGGVDAFCIGSELRSLTQIRGPQNSFPAVAALRTLAADVRSILGPSTKIGYAADWSEYFGYHPQDGSDDVFFHLDPLWADPAIDFVGIDNYTPLSDWRDGADHADADWGSVYDLDYLRGNIAGGEGFDWYYATPQAAATQTRSPISDGAYGEDWVFRYKDFQAWWSNPHYNRPGGVRAQSPTPWVPQGKPIWFTEIGCPAVDKGGNAPNLFFDPKSSESALPPYSNGRRDDFMQWQFLTAQFTYWDNPANNPISSVYGGRMIDMDRAFVWAWDARPFPHFPNRLNVWSDGANYDRGHWLNGRMSARSLASVVREICANSGVTDIDTSELYGIVRGFEPGAGVTGRAALQPLMLAYGFDAIEKDGKVVFRTRHGRAAGTVGPDDLVETEEVDGRIERTRTPDAETVGRVRIGVVEPEGDYRVRSSEAIFPDDTVHSVTQMDLPLLLTDAESRAVAERWLFEARVARDGVRFAIPPSRTDLSAGDLVSIAEPGGAALYRIDQIESAGLQIAEAARVEPDGYLPAGGDVFEPRQVPAFVAPAPVFPVFLDLPLLTGDEVPHAPHIAVTADPWPGTVAVYKSPTEDGFAFAGTVESAAIVGETETGLAAAAPGLWDRGPALRVKLYGGSLSSVTESELLNGANVAAIGSGEDDRWELFQFRDAVLVGPDTYDVSVRLRGQLGTDALDTMNWPVGSRFVLLNAALRQPEMKVSERGLARAWRIGPVGMPVDDDIFVAETRGFDAVGLRPYAPAHLRIAPDGAGGHIFSWIRRTRIDGDSWAGFDVPLGEDSERYLVRVFVADALIREVQTSSATWTYSAAQRTADGTPETFSVEVAQISDRYGPGLFRRIEIDG